MAPAHGACPLPRVSPGWTPSPGRFLHREWRQGQADARKQLGVYPHAVERTVAALHELLDRNRQQPTEAVELKWLYRDRIADRPDFELAETFLNSVTRRLFGIRDVNPHADLLTVRFWRGMQASQAAGDVPDFYPYRACRRLHGADEPAAGEAPPPG